MKYNILGTLFFEKDDETLNIDHISLTFNTPHEYHCLYNKYTMKVKQKFS